MLIAAAASFVVVLWAVSTAAIFYLDSLPRNTFARSFGVTSFIAALTGIGIRMLADDVSDVGIAASFAGGLLVWGWTEMALYMGFITGPRKHRCVEGCSGVRHFGHAISANLWHECLVIALALVLWLSGNIAAVWCFTLLWLMHLSARLNVFLGVRNVSAEFVPEHMDVLKGFLRQRRMNPLYPLSCALLLAMQWYLVTLPASLLTIMAATLVAIGILEHLLLMLPLPIEKLWRWSLSRSSRTATRTQAARPSTIKTDYTLGVPS